VKKSAAAAAGIAALFTSFEALAHGAGQRGGNDAWAIVALCGLAALHFTFMRGVWRLRRLSDARGATSSNARGTSFFAAEIAVAVALVSPLERLAEESLSLHMVQHLILIVAAPILFVWARPRRALAAALPSASLWIVRHRTWIGARPARMLARPLPAAGLHAMTLWIWHLPVLFDAAVANIYWHMAEHAVFFVTAQNFWSAVLRARRDWSAFPSAFVALLVTIVVGGMMSAWIALAPQILFASAGLGGHLSLAPMEDQQFAGILMWVPAGMAYLGAALLLTMVFLRRAAFKEQPREPRVEASRRDSSPRGLA
jgi:putative membrane protein